MPKKFNSHTSSKKASASKRFIQATKSNVKTFKGPKQLVLFNKPFNVLCQFTDEKNASSPRATLKDYIDIPHVYAAGRLDFDSEGLLVLTNDGALANKISSPKQKTLKTYWAQVEGSPSPDALSNMRSGLLLKDGMTAPADVAIINEPQVWPRTPPIRERKDIPTTWLSITISEGRNRQVRRMTANIGHPTLRLIRYKVGEWTIDGIENGNFVTIN